MSITDIANKEERQKLHYTMLSELQSMARELPGCVYVLKKLI